MIRLKQILRFIIPLLCVVVLCCGTSQAALKAFGPTDPVTTLPAWYQDNSNLALQPCLDQNGMCLLPPPFDTGAPITTTPGTINDSNFPGESFYYSADALLNIEPSLELAKLSFVLEAAFLSGVLPDAGIVFLRTDLQKMRNLTPNSTYLVTHPYGTFEFTTDGAGDTTGGGGVAIRIEDPAGGSENWMPPMMKSGHFTGIGPFLRATTGFITRTVGAETHTYIGDPAVGVTVNNGPNGNIFKIERTLTNGLPVTGVSWTTDQWFLAGRVFTGPIASDMAFKATYARNVVDGQVDVFATALPGAVLTLNGTGIAPAVLTLANPANGKQFTHIPLASSTLPTNLTLTNSLDLQGMPPHPVTLVDEVNITLATYNPVTRDVTVKAASRDKVADPAPTLTATNFAVPNTLTAGTLVKNITGTIPPETVTVTSSLGGSSTVPLSVVSVTPAPTAVNDTATTIRDLPVTVTVLLNDIFAGTQDPASVLPASPANGSATANPDGTVTFTPTAGFTGTASFTYTVKDTLGQTSNSAAVTINVIPPPPAVAPDWVGADLANGGNDIFVWWATSPSIGATYTILANGVQQQTGVAGTSTTLTGLANNTTYTISVRTDAPGATSSPATAATPVTINRIAAAPEWVGALPANSGADILVWWPLSTTPGATYTVFANGIQQQSGIAGTSITLTGLANNTSYTVSVRTDAAGYNSSSATQAASAVTVNRTAPAPAWMGVQKGTGSIKLWWPTVSLPGAGYSITETYNGVPNPTPITGPFLVSNGLTYIIMTGKPNGTYSYTIRTTAAGYNDSLPVSGSTAVTLP